MQTEHQRTALTAAKSAQNRPRTQIQELRELLHTIERRLARLKEISAEDVLGILPLLDQAKDMLETLDSAGESTSSEGIVRSERSQFESLLLQLDKKGANFINQAGGPAALRRARQENQPGKDGDRWWWFIDAAVTQKRQQKIRRWSMTAAVVGVVLVSLVLIYNQFLAPDPVFQAGVGFQQSAENKLISGQYEDALADVEQAIERLPDYPELFVLRGVLYEALEEPELAEQSYQLASERLEEITFHNERAKYYLLSGRPEAGMADAETALSINPDSAVSYMYLAQAYEILGDISKAIDYYELAGNVAERTGNATLQVMARMQMATLMQQFNLPTPEAPQE